MHVKRKKIVVKMLLVLACASAVWAAHSGKSDFSLKRQGAIEKEVLETHMKMAKANDSLDLEKFFSFVLDFNKGLIIRDGRLFKTKQEAFDTVKKGFEGISGIERIYEQTYVTVISPETALLTANGNVTVTFSDGNVVSSPFAVSMVYVLKDGQWKMLQGHYSVPNPR